MSKPQKPLPTQSENKKQAPSGDFILGIDAIGALIRRNPQGVLHAKKFDNCPVALIDDAWTTERGLLEEWQRQMVLKDVDMKTKWEEVLESMKE